MNEQDPTESIVSEPADAFARVADNYAQSAQPAEALTSAEHPSGFSSLSTPEPPQYLSNDAQALAHREFPPLAQPLASANFGDLGSFGSSDSWDHGSAAEIRSLTTEMNAPASPLPLQSFAAPETIDTAQRLSAPFSLPSLPSVSFPPGSQLPDSGHIGITTHPVESYAPPLAGPSVESSPLLPPVISGWAPHSPSASASNAHASNADGPTSLSGETVLFTDRQVVTEAPAFGTNPAFSTAPALPTEFSEPTGFPTSALLSTSFPSAPAFPSAPMAFETPSFPAAPSFPSVPVFPAAFAPEQAVAPHSFAAPEPFDAGDSFAPLPEIASYPNLQQNFQAPAAITNDVNASPGDPFAGQVDFSSDPLPRPEALVLKQAEEPTKTGRFGRKKATPTDMLAMAAAPGTGASSVAESVADAATTGAKKAKRFGKKPVKTVDLLGAPLGGRPLDPTDSTKSALATNSLSANIMTAASLPSLETSVGEAADDKPKRKLFARVDRSKEKPLTPNNGRPRKIVQGLAAISLLAGAGLFTMSFLDKKSPTPAPSAPPVETSVAPAAVDPTTSSIPVVTDPATGLPVPLGIPPQAPADPNPALPSVDGTGSVDSVAAASTADSTPLNPTDATPVPVDSTPAQDGQAPATTIAPGPDDLEFSTGGNFSE